MRRMKNDLSNKSIGRRLEAVRGALEIGTQAVMAERLGVDVNRYNNWALGVSRIPLEFANKVCIMSGVDLDYLFRGEVSGLPIRLITLLEESDSSTTKRRGR